MPLFRQINAFSMEYLYGNKQLSDMEQSQSLIP